MATRPLKPHSAIEDVLADFDEIFDCAVKTMTDEEFQQAEAKTKELARVPAASRPRRHETA